MHYHPVPGWIRKAPALVKGVLLPHEYFGLNQMRLYSPALVFERSKDERTTRVVVKRGSHVFRAAKCHVDAISKKGGRTVFELGPSAASRFTATAA